MVRRSAVKARTQTVNQIKALVVTAPEQLREHLRGLGLSALVHACARFRPGSTLADPAVATKAALRSLARRYEMLTAEITDADKALRELVAAAAPTLLELSGVGVEVAGQLLVTAGDNPGRLRSEGAFAQLCGVAPLPASSGITDRHRLNGGVRSRRQQRPIHRRPK